MTKHLTTLLAAALLCGLLVSVSQRRPATATGANPSPSKAATRPHAATKPKRKSLLPTPAEENELLQFLRRSRRDFYNSLMAQKKTSDKRYRGTLQFAWQWYNRYKNLDKSVRSEVDREQKTRIEISKVLGRIKKAKSEAERKKLLTELGRLAGVQFDAQMKITRYKLDQMQNQLGRLRRELSNRHAERKKIVTERVADWLKATTKPVKGKGSDRKK